MWLQWIWNATSLLGVGNLKKYGEYDKIQNTTVLTKCQGSEMLIIAYFTRFTRTHPLRSKSIIKTSFMF